MIHACKVVVPFFLFLVLLVLAASSPLQVVSIDGICKSSSVIGNFVASQALGKTSSPCPIAASFDCASETDGYSVLNSIFETSFSSNSKGMFNCHAYLPYSLFITYLSVDCLIIIRSSYGFK